MLIKVRVTADAPAEKVVKKADDFYVVSVRESAERNLANKRVLEILRKIFPNRSLKLIKGHHAPAKIVEVKK